VKCAICGLPVAKDVSDHHSVYPGEFWIHLRSSWLETVLLRNPHAATPLVSK
jgi:hypothetical protein